MNHETKQELAGSLEEVRRNIDRLDEQIVRLLAERQLYVREAARFKTSSDGVKAPARVEAVMVKVRGLASKHGLDPDIAEAVYRKMIECFIESELQEFHRAR